MMAATDTVSNEKAEHDPVDITALDIGWSKHLSIMGDRADQACKVFVQGVGPSVPNRNIQVRIKVNLS